jgi:hypothetical protein
LTRSAAPSAIFEIGVTKRLSGSTLSNHLPSGREVEGLTLSFWEFQLTNFHKIGIFNSVIHRVAVQIFLRFQEKSLRSVRRHEKTSDKFMTSEDVTLLSAFPTKTISDL